MLNGKIRSRSLRSSIIIFLVLIALLFQVQGASATILTNGGFESGTANWTHDTNGTAVFTVHGAPPTPPEGTNQANVSVGTTPGTYNQLFQYNLNITSGENYNLSFSAYSNTGRDMYVYLILHLSPYTNLGLSTLVPLETGYQSYTYLFTATGTTTNARLRFAFNTYDVAGDKFYIDNVYLDLAGNNTPLSPTLVSTDTGNFWINTSWTPSLTGGITDSYNVTNGSSWFNGTATFLNETLSPHGISDLYIYPYNNSAGGILGMPLHVTAQVPNNQPTITNVSTSYNVYAGESLYIDANYDDVDGDTIMFYYQIINYTSVSLSLPFNYFTGIVTISTQTENVGTHYLRVIADDYYSQPVHVFSIEVLSSAPDIPEIYCNYGNFWINCTAVTAKEWVVYQNE